jgi:hypothetical protein
MSRALCAALLSSLLFAVGSSGLPWMQAAAPPAKPFTLTQVWTLDATYEDAQHGVSFRYPSTWKPGTQFGNVPPVLSTEATTPNAGFGYSEGGFPRNRVVGPYSKTNLEGFGIVYAAQPAASPAACEATAASLAATPGHSTVVLSNRSYSAYQTGGAGMSQSFSGNLYATYIQGTCYLFETGMGSVAPGVVDGVRALTPAQVRSIEAHLFDILKTVRITSRRS